MHHTAAIKTRCTASPILRKKIQIKALSPAINIAQILSIRYATIIQSFVNIVLFMQSVAAAKMTLRLHFSLALSASVLL